MRGVRQRIVRAAVVRPTCADGARRVEGPDEDRFTLLAAALEAAADVERADRRPLRVRVLGTDPAPRGGYAALFGRPVELIGERDGVALPDTLTLATEGPGPEVILAVEELPDGGAARGGTPGLAAIAVLVDAPTGPASPDGIPLDTFPSGESPIVAAYSAWAKGPGTHVPGVGWVGEWPGSERVARRAPRDTSASPPSSQVSQGAYLPPPRYLESLASRWGFLADRCRACGRTTFPQSGRCRGCGRAEDLAVEPLPKHGWKVVARTWIGAGGQPTEFDPEVERQGAYGVVLAELVPGVRATLMVTDAEPGSVRIGTTVETRLRRLYALDGAWRYGRKAVPEVGATPTRPG